MQKTNRLEARMHLSRFPRIRLGHLPTPLEPMDNLSRLLGGPRLWIAYSGERDRSFRRL